MNNKKIFILICFLFLIFAYSLSKKIFVSKNSFNSPYKTYSTFISAVKDKNYDLALKCFLPGTEVFTEISIRKNFDKFSTFYQEATFEIIKEEKINDVIALLVKYKFKFSEDINFMWVPIGKFKNKYLIVDGYYLTNEWEKFETDHIIFHYEKERFTEGPPSDISEQEKQDYLFLGNNKNIFPILEECYKYASEYLNVTLDKKIDYYIVTSKLMFRLLTKHFLENDLPAGITQGDKNRIITFFSYHPHEIIHLLVAKIGNPPLLLNEAFTNYVDSRNPNDYKLKNELSKANSILKNSNGYVPLDFVFKYMGVYKNEPIVESELLLFVDYLITKYSIEKFKNLYAEFKVDNYNEIFRRIYGKELFNLEEDWKEEIGLK